MKDAIPFPPLSVTKNVSVYPLDHSGPVVLSTIHHRLTSSDDKEEHRQQPHLVYLNAREESDLPVDHNLYCLRPVTNEPLVSVASAWLTSQVFEEVLTNESTTVINDTGQELLEVPPDHTEGASSPGSPMNPDEQKTQPGFKVHVEYNLNAQPISYDIVYPQNLSHKKEKRTASTSVESTEQCGTSSDVAQTDETEDVYTLVSDSEELPNSLSGDTELSQEDSIMDTLGLLLGPEPVTGANEMRDQLNIHILPDTPSVRGKSLQKKFITMESLLFGQKKQQSSGNLKLKVNHAKLNIPSEMNKLPEMTAVEQVHRKAPVNTGKQIFVCATHDPKYSKCYLQKSNYNTKINEAMSKKSNSTTLEKMLRAQNRILRLKVKCLTSKVKTLKMRKAKLLAEGKNYFRNYSRLSTQEKLLVDAQLRLARARPRGVRFTEEEKMFAFKLYTISPECYKFLQTYIKLPCTRSIEKFSKTVI